MAYEKQTWTDTATSGTPITAARLNHMEDGIAGAWDSISQVTYLKAINSNSRIGFEWVREDGVLYLYVVIDGQRAMRFIADFPA